MPDNAVGPGRAGQTGSSGGATAAGGTPAPEEAKSVASQFGAPASGAGLEPALSERTQARIRDLSTKLKGAEEELARLKTTPTPGPGSFFTQQPASDPGFDAQVAEYEKLARKAREAGDEDAMFAAMRGMARVEGQRSTNESLKGFFQEQQEKEVYSRFNVERNTALEKMFRDYPETTDPTNEFRKLVEDIWGQDPYLKQLPDGEYKAAEIAWARRARQKLKPQTLESSGAPSRVPMDTEAHKQDREGALEALKRGDKLAVANFFEANLKRIVKHPQ